MAQLKNTVECTMFYGAKPIIFERAKEMRKNPTKAEKSLWEIFRKNQIMRLSEKLNLSKNGNFSTLRNFVTSLRNSV